MERQPRDAPQPHSGSHRRGTGAAAPQRPSSSSEEKSDAVKEKSSKKKVVIPQIVITRASTETLASQSSLEMEQRTIREHADWGPYCRHRNPSTADAYNTEARE
ncbi:spermatogenesis-associated protein 33 [Choloepus didactylus]|uniref:spermatogenesis-associated protein 33 n=1 Tax=Choloepus didactylus TaxID=27675 RepID=UPI0018A02DCF|nr:spermatogenesis-associated protein 33 [Choloepus didactylus]